jgi:hypothetical protein
MYCKEFHRRGTYHAGPPCENRSIDIPVARGTEQTLRWMELGAAWLRTRIQARGTSKGELISALVCGRYEEEVALSGIYN